MIINRCPASKLKLNKTIFPVAVVSVLFIATASLAKDMPEIIAHRGASHDAPENTLSSARLGWEQAELVEIDVHLTHDGKIAVLHDNNTLRTAGVDKKVTEQTFAELRALDAGSWKDARFAGEKIPSLDEIIDAMPDGKKLVIEVKCGPEIIPALRDSLARAGKPAEQFIFIAFSHATIRELKTNFPKIEAYWLSGFRKDETTGAYSPGAPELIEKAKSARVEGLNLSYHGPIDANFVKQVKDAGLKFYVWTVDSPEVAQRLIAAGVDGITTNRPAWLREQLQSAGK